MESYGGLICAQNGSFSVYWLYNLEKKNQLKNMKHFKIMFCPLYNIMSFSSLNISHLLPYTLVFIVWLKFILPWNFFSKLGLKF